MSWRRASAAARVTARLRQGGRAETRRYLRRGLSLDQFFDELERRGVRYAVLRWFESLPDVEPGEDIDILVADDDLDAIGSLLRSYRVPPRRQKFDVYTVSGLPGSDYRGIPYFSSALADGVLQRSVLLRGRYRVPGSLDHFHSMAYHAVYHKGARSGLPETAGAAAPLAAAAEHDYAHVLALLAEQNSISVPLGLEDLDAYLTARGLRPPLDTLEKLGETNEWLRRRVEEQYGPASAGLPGLGVFVLRERAAHLLDRLHTELIREGWEPLLTVQLEGATAARVRASVRGGNWGRGPWPVDGGGPAAYVVAYDLSASVDPDPPADGERVTEAKLAIRRRLLHAVPEQARFNPLHSSDNPRQALDYLALLDDPSVPTRARAEIDRIRAAMTFPFPVVRLLPSRRRRSVTAVVRHPVFGDCVCKLFYPSAGRFLARELRARTDFAALPEVPPLLARGENWLLVPYYTDTQAHVRRGLPGMRQVQLTPETSLALAGLARALHDKGTFLLDLTPFNLLTDPEHGLKVLDWEFLQDYPGTPPPLSGSLTVLGTAGDLPGVDVPLGVSSGGEPSVTVFSPLVTGLPVRLLMRAGMRTITPAAEVGLALAVLFRAGRTAARKTLRGCTRTARWSVRTALRAVERTLSAGALR